MKQNVADLNVRLLADVRSYDVDMQRAAARTDRTTAQIGNAFVRAGHANKQFSTIVQQSGYQMQDFVVQVGAGQNALIAFAQQGSQMAGMFGPAGAIAGAAISIAAVATNMVLLANKTGQATEKLVSYEQALKKLRAEQEKTRFENLNIFEQKGDLERQVRESKAAIEELFQFSNKFEMKKERDRLVRQRADMFGGDPEAQAIEARIRLLDQMQDKVEETNTRIRIAQEQQVRQQQELKKINEQLIDQAAGDLYREIYGPINQLTKEQEEENKALDEGVKAWARHNAAMMEGKRGLAEFNRELRATQSAENLKQIDREMKELVESLSDASKENIKVMEARARSYQSMMMQMWDNVGDRGAQTFADLVLTGQASFSSLVQIVSRSMLEIGARMAIINPIMNSVMGLSGASVLPAIFGRGAIGKAATGKSFKAGQTSLVGENGPEIVRFNQDSQVLSNTRSRQVASFGNSGGTTYIDARNADSAGLARVEAQLRRMNQSIEHRSLAAISDEQRRRGISHY